jgi:DNA processing protein
VDADKLKYWVGFNIIQGIGPTRVRRLLNHFGDLAVAWAAPPLDLAAAGLDRRGIENMVAGRARIDLDAEMDKMTRQGISALTWEDEAYPRLLRPIPAAPPVLYVRGSLTSQDDWAVAVVGTRRATTYGREAAADLAGALAHNRITVVSGLARGIDGIAHRAALDAGGRTIAVLGCGLDVVYPPEHARLARDIISSGALVSDYPLGTQPEARNFPPRNRIISGLALGVLVVEGAQDSGSMITADYALEQGRDVFAVPGTIFSPRSQGTNRLIQQGAKMVTSVQDILEELNLTQASQQMEVRSLIPDNPTEAALLAHLSTEPRHMDEIVRETGLATADVSATLAMMELKGMVRQVGSMTYVLARDVGVNYHLESVE